MLSLAQVCADNHTEEHRIKTAIVSFRRLISTMHRFLLILALVHCASAANYAVLVAGSSGYDNYRHQADVCHAYQILHKNGIPDENIVVMMYDDIAHNVA